MKAPASASRATAYPGRGTPHEDSYQHGSLVPPLVLVVQHSANFSKAMINFGEAVSLPTANLVATCDDLPVLAASDPVVSRNASSPHPSPECRIGAELHGVKCSSTRLTPGTFSAAIRSARRSSSYCIVP